MTIIDPGHKFLIKNLDVRNNVLHQELTFVKRAGPNYPGNNDAYPGTTLQEVFRACIERLMYLNKQKYHKYNRLVIKLLRICIYLLERRAAYNHRRKFYWYISNIELCDTCYKCNHIGCYGECQ